MSVELTAPAKINLGIQILGKRPDGFHDILSVFQTVSLCDRIVMEQGDRTQLTCTHPDIPLDDRNLMIKAHAAFEQRFGVSTPVSYHLDKVIPTGAGLGGGSSDAAAVLRGLAALHEIPIDDPGLVVCAGAIGSDVPFALAGGTAVVSGRGEVVKIVQWPFSFAYVIVYPGFGVSTAWAYGQLRNFVDDAGVYETMTQSLENGTIDEETFFAAQVNDLEDVVFQAHPEGKAVRDGLLANDARAAFLTGSGSCLVGVFDTRESADTCAVALSGGDCRAFAVSAVAP